MQGDPATVPRRARISHLSAADRLTRIAQAAHSETATGSPTWVNFARSSIQIQRAYCPERAGGSAPASSDCGVAALIPEVAESGAG